jgi:glycosyltransferase involved in cell wall biosynthesis
MKKIIYISPFNIYPSENGGSRYIYNYIRHLAKRNDVYYLGLENQSQFPKEYNIKQYNVFKSGIKKYIDPKSYWKALRISKMIKPHEVIVAMPYQIFFTIFIAKLLNAKSIHHEQNIEFLRFKRIGKWWWPLMYIYERMAYLFVDKTLYISETDKESLKKYFKISEKRLSYSPYIVDEKIFRPNEKARDEIRRKLNLNDDFIILFFGPLNYKPNTEALNEIIKKIAPKIIDQNNKVKFVIAGKNPPTNIKNKNIIFTGFVEKIEDYINACDLVIVPLLSGGGVRTKILESLACKKIVISSKMGAEGINAMEYNGKLIICNDTNSVISNILNHV